MIAGGTAAAAGILAGASALSMLTGARKSGGPSTAPIPVGILLDQNAAMIDFAGPWEALLDASITGVAGFQLMTIAPTADIVRVSGGMQLMPDYTIDDTPPVKVIVIPAQRGSMNPRAGNPKVEWLKEQYKTTDIIMSVCTGAFLLAQTGLLDGLEATTHHDYVDELQTRYPHIKSVANRRFVDNGKLITTGGLSSGIEGALHVVSRYYGPAVSAQTADYMEYVPQKWGA